MLSDRSMNLSIKEKGEMILKSLLEAGDARLKEMMVISDKIKETSENLKAAAAENDLRENQAYINNLENLQFLYAKQSQYKDWMDAYEGFKKGLTPDGKIPALESDSIDIGSTVTVENDGVYTTILLVPKKLGRSTIGAVAENTPLGKELLGRRKGDKVAVKTPGALILDYNITEVN